VYENRRVLPRTYLTDTIAVLKGDEALRAIRSGMDLTRTAIVEEPLPDGELPERVSGPPGTAHIARYRDHQVVVETESDGRRLLVLSDVYYPGWRARIDGSDAPVRVVNAAFRGVSVPAGKHRVEFTYEPASFRYGAIASLLGVGLLTLMVVLRPRGRGSEIYRAAAAGETKKSWMI
jgi:hypothetical protein